MNWIHFFASRGRKLRRMQALRKQLAVTTCAAQAFDLLGQIEALEMDGLWSWDAA